MTTTTQTLADFLLARIAEDEAVARAASIGSESWHLGDEETVVWWPPEPPPVIDANYWRGMTIDAAGEEIAPHIARWDPGRVLAECKAKRRIVDMYLNGFNVSAFVLQALALPYADHPDYQQVLA